MRWAAKRGKATQIKQADGEYVLALKGNQGKLNQQVEAWFEQAQANGFSGIEYSYHQTMETGHHRIETRYCMGSVRESITSVASPESVGGVNHGGDGQADATVME